MDIVKKKKRKCWERKTKSTKIESQKKKENEMEQANQLSLLTYQSWKNKIPLHNNYKRNIKNENACI